MLYIDAVAEMSNESLSSLMMFKITGAKFRYESYLFHNSICIKQNYNLGIRVKMQKNVYKAL